MNNIIFVSPFHRNLEHIIFEASVIKLYHYNNPKSSLIYIGQAKHFSIIKNFLPDWIWIVWYIFDIENRIILFWLCLFQSFFFRKSTIVYLALDIHYIYFFTIFWPKIATVFMHRYPRDSKNILLKYINIFLLKNFLFFQRKVCIFVLWEWIFNRINRDFSLSKREKKCFKWMNHPYLTSTVLDVNDFEFKNIKFWFIWRQKVSYKKNIYSEINNIQNFISNYWGFLVSTGEEIISQEEYFKLINSCTYLMFISNPEAYMYRCSWIFIESIIYWKPIICLSSGISDYFFQKFWNIWYSCSSLDEMKMIITRILTEPFNYVEYETQVKNLNSFKKSFSDVDLLSKQLFFSFPDSQ